MPEDNINPLSPTTPPARNAAHPPATRARGDRGPETGKHDGLKLKKNYYEPLIHAETDISGKQTDSESDSSLPPTPFHRKRDTSRILRQNIRFVTGWLLFIVFGSGLVYLRFFSHIPGLAPDLLKQFGMIAVGITYLVSIFLALKDNMFDGLLALVVPFYPFYYLFSGSGSAFFRAIAAALLAAFGFDCLLLIQSIALNVFDRVSHWIQTV